MSLSRERSRLFPPQKTIPQVKSILLRRVELLLESGSQTRRFWSIKHMKSRAIDRFNGLNSFQVFCDLKTVSKILFHGFSPRVNRLLGMFTVNLGKGMGKILISLYHTCRTYTLLFLLMISLRITYFCSHLECMTSISQTKWSNQMRWHKPPFWHAQFRIARLADWGCTNSRKYAGVKAKSRRRGPWHRCDVIKSC